MGNLSSVSDAWDRLQEAFDNAPEVGYVWTISIDSDAAITALGLGETKYHLKLSCSHVGETMFGVWGGEMDFETKSNFRKLQGLMAVMGLGSSMDLNVWFKNDRFLMNLLPYCAADEDEFVEDYIQPLYEAPEGMDPAAAAAGSAMVSAIQNAAISGTGVSKSLKNAVAPEGFYRGYYTNHTEGDLSQSVKLFGFVTPAVVLKGQVETDEDGQSLNGGIHAVAGIPPIMPPRKFNENVEEEIATPFPYTINVFADGSVLFRLYNSSGGPITVNFFGKMDKIPVEETIKP